MLQSPLNIAPFRELSHSQKLALLNIWNQEYPRQLGYENLMGFEKYLLKLKDAQHLLLVDQQKRIKGWLALFTREEARWFLMLLQSEYQGMGLGTRLLHEAKTLSPELNGWVIDHARDIKANGDPYISPLPFYQKNGFTLIPEIRIETEQISCVKIQWKSDETGN